ncbi:MAG TPA: efflux RND transporter permease subunit [Trebonia sp.]|nr:efflux RND transporter permease subunit [Trebonia sp.]
MRWVVRTSLRFRFVVAGLACVLLYFGVISIGQQKVDAFPEFAPVSVEVQTACLGLSPAEVEQLTTIPLEQSLHGVPGVYDIRSDSEPQLSAIFMYFRSGYDYLHARQLVQERLQATSPALPTWCDPPQMYPIVSATSRVMQVGVTTKSMSLMDLSQIAQYTIRPRLMAVPGVANVAIWGYRDKQIMVEADPTLMAEDGISLDTLMSGAADAVDSGELKYTSGAAVGSLGTVATPDQQLPVHNIQPIDSPAQMANVPLQAGKNGKFLTIGDVASVTYDYPTLAGDAVINGGQGLMMVIEKFPDANTIDVTNGITQAFAQLQPGLKGISVDPNIFRQASFIETAIHNLTLAVVLGCILVVFVLFIFLFQWRAALVSLLAIPLSLAAAVIVLNLMGTTINTMILAGFAVAVGVVVDDAIIDMENIVRRLRAWKAEGRRITPLRLVLGASLEVRVAILYATLINIVAVIPVMVVGGLTGAFFEPLAIAYGLAVLASMLVALTVTPALGLVLMPGARLGVQDPPLMRLLKRGYQAALRPLLGGGVAATERTWRRARWAFPAVVAVAIVGGFAVYPHLSQDLFPTFKEPDFLMHFVTKPGTSVQEQDRMVANLQDQVLKVPGVTDAGSHIGQAIPGEEVSGVNFSETWLSLSPNASYDQVEGDLRNLADSYPGAFSDVQTYLHERIDEVLTNGTTEDVAVFIEGPDINTLASLGNQLAGQMGKLPGLDDVQPAPLEFIPEADVTVNVAAAARYGLSPGDVRRDAAVLMASEPVSTISTPNVLTVVAVWSTPATRNSLQDLSMLPIDTASGGHVPLGKVATITIKPTPSQIIRDNSVRMTEVDADIAPGSSISSVAGHVKALIAADERSLPAGYTLSLQGEIIEREAAQQRLILYGIAALVVILLLLQAAFRSWRLAWMLLLTLPMALVGGVLIAWASLGTITLGALVGFFAVLGIAARNGILLIAHFRHMEQEEGVPFGRELVIRGASERLAPILMTALATALALAPLVVNGNRPGQEIEYPMAIVILGGLLTSTVLNLFILPALYLAFGQARQRPARGDEGGPTPC